MSNQTQDRLLTVLSPLAAEQRPSAFEPAALHPLAIAAANQVRESLRAGWISPTVPSAVLYGRDGGKMFGVLVVRAPDQTIGFLRAFSGQLDGTWDIEGYVPPVFDRARREQTEPRGEAVVRRFTARILALESSTEWAELRSAAAALAQRHAREDLALKLCLRANRASRHDGSGTAATTGRDDETEHRREKKRMREEREAIERTLERFASRLRRMKQLRLAASRICSKQLYDTYAFTNAQGQSRTLWDLCAPSAPPSGTGDCAAPKLIVHALRNGLAPLALAEFWFGKAPRSGGKSEGSFYPPCSEKCGLVLPFLLGDPSASA